MTRVAGVFGNFWCLPLTPPGIEVLDGRKLGPSDVLGRTHYPLLCLAAGGRAVAIPGGDATSQDSLEERSNQISRSKMALFLHYNYV
jgi:hypothetical protein